MVIVSLLDRSFVVPFERPWSADRSEPMQLFVSIENHSRVGIVSRAILAHAVNAGELTDPLFTMAQFHVFHPVSIKALIIAIVLPGMLSTSNDLQAQLLVDNFDRPNANTVGNGWTEFETVSPTAVRVQGNQLRMGSSAQGRDHVSKLTPGDYAPQLDNNGFLMEWSFNLQQNSGNPNGFNNGQVGIAVVLAGTHADLMAGSGYAVVHGQPGSDDPIRLVRYTSGISSDAALTNLISVGDFGAGNLAVRVTYDPLTGQWAMFYTHTGSGGFADPKLASTPAGTAIDRTLTSIALPYIGLLFNHGTYSGGLAVFDNLSVPEDLSTSVFFSPLTAVSISSEAEYHTIMVGIKNPDPYAPVLVDVILQSGNSATLYGWTTQTVKFEPGSSAPVAIELPIREYGGCAGDDELVFSFHNLSGGVGAPYVGLNNTYRLTVEDRANATVLLEESFETDGNGSRYIQSIATGVAGGGYFLRADAASFTAAGSPTPTNVNGTQLFGALNLSGLATNAEASVLFNNVDIRGVSAIAVNLSVGARNANVFDNAVNIRDYLYVETKIDGGAWTMVGSFRSSAPGSTNSKPMAQDTDFDGVGDGIVLKPGLRQFTFPVPGSGQAMEVRIRFRTNDANEEIYFDQLRVQGSLCTPVYYSTSSGLISDPIWSEYRSGSTGTAQFDHHSTLVVQSGHVVSNGTSLELDDLTVEVDAQFLINTSTVIIHGKSVQVDGLLRGGQGDLGLRGTDATILHGTGTFNLFNLSVDVPAGVTADALVDIRGTMQLRNGTFTALDRVRLRSTSTGTGRLASVPATADYVGDLTVQRYIPAGATNWRMLGSPVVGATVAQWREDVITTGFPGAHYPNYESPLGSGILWSSIRSYDETNADADMSNGLVAVTGVDQILEEGQGFAVWAGSSAAGTDAFTMDVVGPPRIARTSIDLPLSYTNTGNPAADGWNLVSNPLPSAIAFTAIEQAIDVQNAYWIFDPATGNNASWSGGFATNGADGVIRSGQAFWMRTTGSNFGASLNENAKVSTLTGGTFGGQLHQNAALVRLSVRSAINAFSDETLVVFEQGSPAHDVAEGDADKMLFGHPDAPRIATLAASGTPMAISMYGTIANDITIPVMVQVGVSGTYSVAVDQFVAPGALSCVTLEDLLTGQIMQISQGATYTLEIEAGTDPTQARLLIHATAPKVFTTTDVACSGGSTGKAVLLIEEGPAEVQWTDALGNVLQSHVGVPAGEVVLSELGAGTYTVQLGSSTLCGTLSHSFTISEPYAMEMNVTTNSATCGSSADGSIAVEVLGGTAPYSYQWSNGSNSENVDALSPGIYAVAVTDANACVIEVGAITIHASFGISGEVIAAESAAVGVPVNFSSIANTGSTHFWEFGDGATSEALEPQHTFSGAGEYTVRLTLAVNGCDTTVEHPISVHVVTGIADAQMDGLSAWYNGSSIVFANTQGVAGELRVLDALGRMVVSQAVTPGTERSELAVHNWPAGVYHLQFDAGSSRWVMSLPVGY